MSGRAMKSEFKFRLYLGGYPHDMVGWYWECAYGGGAYISRDGPFKNIHKAFQDVIVWGWDHYQSGDPEGDFDKKDKDLLAGMVAMGEDMERAGYKIWGSDNPRHNPKYIMNV